MDSEEILEDLLAILDRSGAAIKREHMEGSGGGLCQIRGRRLFYVDLDATVLACAESAARAVCELVDLELVYMRPGVRQFVESVQG